MRPIRRILTAPAIKRTLHACGALPAWHRLRNRDHLTVIMFHRVLSPRDPRWASADPEYTLSDELFARCLEFFQRHYHVVSLAQLRAARAGSSSLPERPLLITFDDGWSDTEEFALPHLERAGLPAVLFVVGSAVDRREPFWQEQMVHAFRAGRLTPSRAEAAFRALDGAAAPPRFGDDLEGLRALIASLEKTDAARRASILASLDDVLADPVRYMVTEAQLQNLAKRGVAIGAHGQSHEPLIKVDAAAELPAVRDELAKHVATAPVLSFPHGRFDARTIEAAHAAGFELLFTSRQELPRRDARGPGLLGRVGFTAEMISEGGRFAPEKLALHLFRKPHAA